MAGNAAERRCSGAWQSKNGPWGYVRSRMVATPWPKPMHIVDSA